MVSFSPDFYFMFTVFDLEELVMFMYVYVSFAYMYSVKLDVRCNRQHLVYVIEIHGYVFQATVADSFLADLDELSDNEDDILVSVLFILFFV